MSDKIELIRTEELEMVYRTEAVETLALNKINLRIEQGEFVSIMGPSGCGKSTLLNVLGMLDKPSGGTYAFNEQVISSKNESQRAEIRKNNVGFVFQSFNLIDELSVFENVELPLVYLKTPATERREKVNTLLERMGIAHRANHYPQQLSGGQQQRVAVARALVADPKVIFADEPTGNLDSVHGDEVMQLLTELNRSGTTIVMVTHSSYDASFSERTLNLFDGKLVSETSNIVKAGV
jgi:putative ABC transport system ATP-binding protein